MPYHWLFHTSNLQTPNLQKSDIQSSDFYFHFSLKFPTNRLPTIKIPVTNFRLLHPTRKSQTNKHPTFKVPTFTSGGGSGICILYIVRDLSNTHGSIHVTLGTGMLSVQLFILYLHYTGMLLDIHLVVHAVVLYMCYAFGMYVQIIAFTVIFHW